MRVTSLCVLAVVGGLACKPAPRPAAAPAAAPPPAPSRAAVKPLSPRWVTIYDPARAWDGYTLTLHDLRVPVLLDMNGRVVHAWPDARLKSRVRLLPDGAILGLGLGRSVVEYDWKGTKTWEFHTAGAIPHHDVIRLVNGNTLVLVLEEARRGKERAAHPGGDVLLEVDRSGAVVWTWRAQRLGALLPRRAAHAHDVTHVNSVEELGDNPWYRAGDARFRPGNLLLSARNLNLLFVVDRTSGAVVWSYRGGLDRQHEARVAGDAIEVLDNRPASIFTDHQSEILTLDPRRGTIRTRFRLPGFFTPTGGTQQRLPNGNLLVTSTRGGRVFEATSGGAIVWEWVPPYEPVRALRVARDACPQLAALEAALPRPVVPPAGYRYVDPDAYRFARRGSRMQAEVGGTRRVVLAAADECRDLLLPAGATLEAGFGIDRARWGAGAAGRAVRFTLRLEPARGPAEILVDQRVGAEGDAWRSVTVPLDRHALESVRLCVGIDHPGPRDARWAFWEQPDLRTALDRARAADLANALDGLTPEERAVQLEHLRALGYLN